jgi:hypothetical protein
VTEALQARGPTVHTPWNSTRVLFRMSIWVDPPEPVTKANHDTAIRNRSLKSGTGGLGRIVGRRARRV